MKALGRYAVATTLVVTIAVAAMWPFLGGTGRTSLLVAAGIAVPVQGALFLLLVHARGDANRFLLRWAIGLFARVGVIVAIGLLLPRLGGLDGNVLILSLCGLFFALLLLEPLFLRSPAPARFAQ